MFFVIDEDGLTKSSVINVKAGIGVINICEKQDKSTGTYRPNRYRIIDDSDTETNPE